MPTEATFFLAGLFVIAAATGWGFSRYLSLKEADPPPQAINEDYLRGLNLVLNRQTEEALELFVRMAKVDEETLETHFALGHLFRRRGEIDRAIRIHQNLLARPGLDETQRDQAQFSLAQDYLGAGLFDRAETLFGQLRKSSSFGEAALQNLVDIYEREQEWGKAIEAHREIEILTGEKYTEIAHYYCELAEKARLDGNLDLARHHLKGSVRTVSGAFRGVLIKAAIAQEEEGYPEALRLYEQVLEADSRFMVEVLPELFNCYHEDEREVEFERYLQSLIIQNSSMANVIAYAAIVADLKKSKVIKTCVESFILGDSMLSSFIDAENFSNLSDSSKEKVTGRITSGLRKLALSSPRYRCNNCGYRSEKILWHCPSCKSWESIRPAQEFQLESLIN
jgi:lipopolysaccharide biosynthesis regulator YciM